MDTLPHLLANAVRSNPHKVAIIEGERKLTYLGLQEKVRSLAGQVGGMGVKPRASVALLLPNGADFVASFLAVAELGAIAVPLNTHYRQNELTYFLSDSRASALITLKESEHQCRRVLARLMHRCDLLVLDETAVWQARHVFPCEEQSAIKIPTGHHCPDENVIYQYTSGSTGHPKRIARTHSNLIFELNSLAKTMKLNSEDKFLGVVPFSHVNGLMRSMLASLSVGATLVPVREFKRQMIAKTIQRERITVFIGVPFIFSILGETNFRESVDFLLP